MKVLFSLTCWVLIPTSLQQAVISVLAHNGIYLGATGAMVLVIALFGGEFFLNRKLQDAWQDQKASREYAQEKLSSESLTKEAVDMYNNQLEEADSKKSMLIGVAVGLVVLSCIAFMMAFSTI